MSYHLIDTETHETITTTPSREVIEASLAEPTGTGTVLVDSDGDVVRDGTWDAQQPGVRRAYVLEVA
jgi:hypothetical protein